MCKKCSPVSFKTQSSDDTSTLVIAALISDALDAAAFAGFFDVKASEPLEVESFSWKLRSVG